MNAPLNAVKEMLENALRAQILETIELYKHKPTLVLNLLVTSAGGDLHEKFKTMYPALMENVPTPYPFSEDDYIAMVEVMTEKVFSEFVEFKSTI